MASNERKREKVLKMHKESVRVIVRMKPLIISDSGGMWVYGLSDSSSCGSKNGKKYNLENPSFAKFSPAFKILASVNSSPCSKSGNTALLMARTVNNSERISAGNILFNLLCMAKETRRLRLLMLPFSYCRLRRLEDKL